MWIELDVHFWPDLKHGQMITTKGDGGERAAIFCSSSDEWWIVDQDTKKDLAPTHYYTVGGGMITPI